MFSKLGRVANTTAVELTAHTRPTGQTVHTSVVTGLTSHTRVAGLTGDTRVTDTSRRFALGASNVCLVG